MCDKMPSFRFMVGGTYSYHWVKMIKHAPIQDKTHKSNLQNPVLNDTITRFHIYVKGDIHARTGHEDPEGE